MGNLGIDIKRVVKIVYKPEFRSVYHTHSFYHFIYVLEGTGIICINNTVYTAQADNIFVIPTGALHYIATHENHTFKTIEVKFTLDNEEYDIQLRQLPYIIQSPNRKICYMLDSVMLEAINKYSFFKLAISVKFSDVLLQLLRSQYVPSAVMDEDPLADSAVSESGDTQLDNAIRYIDENIGEQILVEQLAQIVHLSESYFCTLFKARYGVSPIHYINDIRFSKAKELMRYSDMNISKITESLGFSSLHYFSKFFKQREGISPREFMARMKNDVRIDIDESGQSFII